MAAAFVFSSLLFMSLISYISKHPKKNTKPLKAAFIVIFLVGMVMYCYCHYRVLNEVVNGELKDKTLEWAKSEDSSEFFRIFYVVMRSVVDVGTMFSGRGNSAVFYSLPESKSPLLVFGFWLLHMIAFFTASGALLIRFGDDFLKWFRKLKVQMSNVDLIFGINEDSIVFGKNIVGTKGSMLVYVDDGVKDDYEASIRKLDGTIYSDADALKATQAFLKNIRIEPKKTRLRVFALSREYDSNFQYARRMIESLNALQISPEQTELVLLGTDERKGMYFQVNNDEYGYGNVFSFDEFEINARLLISKYPLCNAINFDENGRATEDLDVLIVGIGRIGHEVLRKVIANGQFEGSNFHVTIYDPKFDQRTGFSMSQYPRMFSAYDMDFELQDGRSYKIFQFIKEKAATLKYIVICLENKETSRDIALRIVDYLNSLGYSQNVYTCDSKSVRCYSAQLGKECETTWIYDSELLYSGKLDRYAMELNHQYCILYGGTKTLEEDWKECKYFHRMSSRASVDYLIPLIRRITSLTNANELTPEQRENLAKNEHLRWCAFHYTFGYDVMDKEEFIQRLKARQAKPNQDAQSLKHACLVSWDELDEISRIENSFTHGHKNYKENDRKNVDMIMWLMRDEENEREKKNTP